MKLPITITYNNGDEATYVAQPPEWARWEKETGKTVTQAQGQIGIYDLMLLAYNAYKREAAGKPTKAFNIWMDTIADVKAGEDDPKSSSAEASEG